MSAFSSSRYIFLSSFFLFFFPFVPYGTFKRALQWAKVVWVRLLRRIIRSSRQKYGRLTFALNSQIYLGRLSFYMVPFILKNGLLSEIPQLIEYVVFNIFFEVALILASKKMNFSKSLHSRRGTFRGTCVFNVFFVIVVLCCYPRLKKIQF